MHVSDANLAWIVNSYALAFGGLLLLGGRAGDLFGRRRMSQVGIAVFTLASLLGGTRTERGPAHRRAGAAGRRRGTRRSQRARPDHHDDP